MKNLEPKIKDEQEKFEKLNKLCKQYEVELRKLKVDEKTARGDDKKNILWVEKAITIISRYDFYDFHNRVLELLLDKLYGSALDDLKTFEHYIYSIVFEIPCPHKGDKNGAVFEGNRMCLPDITELPYVNSSHFDKLLKGFDSEKDLVRVFTSLLLEERVLLIMDKAEDLLPMAYALQSLIYPFELAILVPYLANDVDESQIDVSNLQHVSQPYSYLIGVIEKDKQHVIEMLRNDMQYDERTSPIIIDLTSKSENEKGKTRIKIIDGQTTAFSLEKGVCTELPKLFEKDNSLPKDEECKLINEI